MFGKKNSNTTTDPIALAQAQKLQETIEVQNAFKYWPI